MTKEQFLKTYGQPNTVVSFKNDEEKMEFLKECEKFDIRWKDGTKAMDYNGIEEAVSMNKGDSMTTASLHFYKSTSCKVIIYTPSPKSLIKDGWMGVQNDNTKVWLLPSINLGAYYFGYSFQIKRYDDALKSSHHSDKESLKELYDNLGNLQWKREEKSTKDIEIERIQAEMNKLADDLSKLKGE